MSSLDIEILRKLGENMRVSSEQVTGVRTQSDWFYNLHSLPKHASGHSILTIGSLCPSSSKAALELLSEVESKYPLVLFQRFFRIYPKF